MEPLIFLFVAALNASIAFSLSYAAAGKSSRLGWLAVATLAAACVVVLLVGLGPQPPINYVHVALYAPWLVWVPLSLLYGAWHSLKTGERILAPWPYVMAVVFVSIAQGFAVSAFNHPAIAIAASVGTVLLTYPMGLPAGALIAIPLIYSGIATPEEAYAVASPALALLGYLQWYVLLPRLAKRNGTTANPSLERTSTG